MRVGFRESTHAVTVREHLLSQRLSEHSELSQVLIE